MTVMIAQTFVEELKAMGVLIPDRYLSITLKMRPNKLLKLYVDSGEWGVRRIDLGLLSGDSASRLMKDTHQLPTGITKLTIVATPGSIVTTTIEYATPKGSMGFLSRYIGS